MQKNIHPTWYRDCQVSCSCGNKFATGSTQKTLNVDICDQCHPFFTGEMKFVDRQGRVDKFQQKMKAAQAKKTQLHAKKAKKQKQLADQKDPESYRDILRSQQRVMKSAAKSKAKSAPKTDQKK